MSIQGKASRVGLATFCSRILGLIRDQMFAALLGAGYFADAFVIAFRIPNLLRDLFAEGALSQAFVPTISKIQNQNEEEAKVFLQNMLGTLILVLGGLVLLGVILAPAIVSFIAPGFGDVDGKRLLTIDLTRMMFPFLLLVSISALLMATLNALNHFTIPAFAPLFFNVSMIATGAALILLKVPSEIAVYYWSAAVLLGGILQAAFQMPKLRHFRYRLKPRFTFFWRDFWIRKVGKLMLPAVIANSGTQINIIVNTILASLLVQGTPSWLNYAFRLFQFPIGVFAVAIAVVNLSHVSRDAAKKDFSALRSNLQTSLNLGFALALPSMLGLILLREDIVRLVFERGAFTAIDTLHTGEALMFYAFGLPFYTGVKILAPTFFALDKSYIPMMASLAGILLNIAFNLLTYQTYGHKALALGTSLGVLLNFGLLFFFLMRLSLMRAGNLAIILFRTGAASTSIGLACTLSARFLENINVSGDLAYVGLSVLLSAGFYFPLLKLLGVSELDPLLRRIKRL